MCECEKGWFGLECECFDYCDNIICFNFGICFFGEKDFFCLCEKNYFGKICNIINYCENINCIFFCICMDNLNGYLCDCFF